MVRVKGQKTFVNLKSSELADQKGIERDVSDVGFEGKVAYEIKLADLNT